MSQTTVERSKAEIASSLSEFVALRRDLHRHPELAFEETRTSDIVGNLLDDWGYDVMRGIGGTGIVASLARGAAGRTIGIRADMDALPIHEESGLPYASERKGLMHACGHDGHTTILLCAAKHIAMHGRFDGTVRLIFQPAEEIGTGAKGMIEDGLFERFPVDAIFGLHNWPGLAAGKLGFISGPALASSDTGVITVVGKGGHGAYPHTTVDPVVAASAIVMAVQTIVSRNVPPLETGVASIGAIHGGTVASIVPDEVELHFTLRAFKDEVRDILTRRLAEVAKAQAAVHGATAKVEVRRSVVPLFNHPVETDFAMQVAVDTFGADQTQTLTPFTGGEDFAFFLQKRPGSFIHVGNGETAGLHNPQYDFNDEAIAPAALYWVRLAEAYLSADR